VNFIGTGKKLLKNFADRAATV